MTALPTQSCQKKRGVSGEAGGHILYFHCEEVVIAKCVLRG